MKTEIAATCARASVFLFTSIAPCGAHEPVTRRGGIFCSFGKRFAFRLGLVDAERIELRELVEESRLRRQRDVDFCRHEQNGLAQLPVPTAIGELLALEGGELELRRLQVGNELFLIVC